MKYLCLVYLAAEHENSCSDSDCASYAAQVQASGRMIAAEALFPVGMATTVRIRNNKMMLTDGPFAETKEQLAGFYLIEAQDLNEAILVASKIPPAKFGSIEVRPVRPLTVSADA